MKKFAMILVCMMLAVVMLLPAGAAAPDQTSGADALGAAWQWYEQVPDYSSGYWLGEDGVLTVGLVDEAGKAEVLSIVGDAPVHFVMQRYSYNELMAVQKELENCFQKDVGLVTVGIYVMENVVKVGIDTANPNAAAFMEKMTSIYGDKVFFEGEDGLRVVVDVMDAPSAESPIITGTIVPTEGADEEMPEKTAPTTVIGVALLAAAAVLLNRSRRKQTEEKKEDE